MHSGLFTPGIDESGQPERKEIDLQLKATYKFASENSPKENP